MLSSVFFLFLWALALFLGYKFVFLNIKQVERFSDRYFENMEEDTDLQDSHKKH